jgi:hypothetical protein
MVSRSQSPKYTRTEAEMSCREQMGLTQDSRSKRERDDDDRPRGNRKTPFQECIESKKIKFYPESGPDSRGYYVYSDSDISYYRDIAIIPKYSKSKSLSYTPPYEKSAQKCADVPNE